VYYGGSVKDGKCLEGSLNSPSAKSLNSPGANSLNSPSSRSAKKRGMKIIPFAPETVGRSTGHYLTSMDGSVERFSAVEAHVILTDSAVQLSAGSLVVEWALEELELVRPNTIFVHGSMCVKHDNAFLELVGKCFNQKTQRTAKMHAGILGLPDVHGWAERIAAVAPNRQTDDARLPSFLQMYAHKEDDKEGEKRSEKQSEKAKEGKGGGKAEKKDGSNSNSEDDTSCGDSSTQDEAKIETPRYFVPFSSSWDVKIEKW